MWIGQWPLYQVVSPLVRGEGVRLRVQSRTGAGVVYLSVKKKTKKRKKENKLFAYIILLDTFSLARLNLFMVCLFLIVLNFFFNFIFLQRQ